MHLTLSTACIVWSKRKVSEQGGTFSLAGLLPGELPGGAHVPPDGQGSLLGTASPCRPGTHVCLSTRKCFTPGV